MFILKKDPSARIIYVMEDNVVIDAITYSDLKSLFLILEDRYFIDLMWNKEGKIKKKKLL